MYKIGDKVLYKDNTTVRSIRDINEKGELLLWGMYEYTDPKNVYPLEMFICHYCEEKVLSKEDRKYILDSLNREETVWSENFHCDNQTCFYDYIERQTVGLY